VFIDHEIVGGWDMLVDSDLMKVELSSVVDLNKVIIVNCFSTSEMLLKIKVIFIFDLFEAHFELLFLCLFGSFDQFLSDLGWLLYDLVC
jgi:hypothetical protein